MFKILKKYKGSILAGLLEIIIVFVGISISLYIDDWREENDNREKEAIYLEELYYDVTADMIALNTKANNISSARNRLRYVNNALHFPDSLPLTQMEFKYAMSKAFRVEKFVSRDYTFSDLTGTGNIKLILDKEIRKTLFSYYGKVKELLDVEDINNKVTAELLTNDLMRVFPTRQLFEYTEVFDGIKEITELDMSFFKEMNSEKFICLENSSLLRSSLLSIESYACFKVATDGMILRQKLGDYLGLPKEEDFIKEVVEQKIEPKTLLENYRNQFAEFTLIETPLNDIIYTILDEHPIVALKLFQLNAELYPNSPNVFDSLGDGYLANGDKKKAIENFKKAYEMDPFLVETKNKIDDLELK